MAKHATKNRHDFDLHGDIAKLKEILADTAIHMKDRATGALSDSVENVKERSLELGDNMKTYIADRPVQSLGVAIVSGMFLGYWMRGKRTNSHRR